MNAQTIEQLSAMKLAAMRDEYRRQCEMPTMNDLSFDDRFSMLVNEQYVSKFNSTIKRLVKDANLRDICACMENIDFSEIRNLNKNAVLSLSNCDWIRSGNNVIVTGATGVGKTYLVSALGKQACVKGFKVKSYRVTRLLTDLTISKGDGTYTKKLKDLVKPSLLILDDFGIKQLDVSMSQDFLEVIEDRYYHHKSLAISAQLPVRDWPNVFQDQTIADAILDRVVHNAYRFELKGPSRRASIKISESDEKYD